MIEAFLTTTVEPILLCFMGDDLAERPWYLGHMDTDWAHCNSAVTSSL